MKILVTENQNYILRRLQQFIDIVEDQIEGYEQHHDDAWWCSVFNPETFLDNLKDRSIEEFVNENWEFFHDDSEVGGANIDVVILYDIVNQEYGNYIKNLFIRKCNYFRF